MHLDSSRNGTLTATDRTRRLHPAAGPLLPTPGQGPGIPSACEALAARLDLASVVDVDPQVRAALAQLAEWLRTGDYCEADVIARWLVGVHRDLQPW